MSIGDKARKRLTIVAIAITQWSIFFALKGCCFEFFRRKIKPRKISKSENPNMTYTLFSVPSPSLLAHKLAVLNTEIPIQGANQNR